MEEQVGPELSGFIRLPAVLKLIPVGKSTWWAGAKQGRFPSPVRLSPNITVWRTEDIKTLINQIGRKG